MSEPRRNPVGAFFGALLMAVGGLVAALSGMCTAYFAIGSLFDGGGSGNVFGGLDVLVIALVVGGIPFGIGVVMFLAGRSLYRASLPLPEDPPVAEEGPERDNVTRLAAWGLVAVGVVLIAMPGLCTWAMGGGEDFGAWLATTAVGGCIPIVFGASVAFWGRRILRRTPSPAPAGPAGGQAGLGVVLILLALGAVGSCAGPLGVLGPRMTSDTAFYGYGIFSLLVFLAGLVVVLGLWLILDSRKPPKRRRG